MQLHQISSIFSLSPVYKSHTAPTCEFFCVAKQTRTYACDICKRDALIQSSIKMPAIICGMTSSQTLELLLYPPYFPVDQTGNPPLLVWYLKATSRWYHTIDITWKNGDKTFQKALTVPWKKYNFEQVISHSIKCTLRKSCGILVYSTYRMWMWQL